MALPRSLTRFTISHDARLIGQSASYSPARARARGSQADILDSEDVRVPDRRPLVARSFFDVIRVQEPVRSSSRFLPMDEHRSSRRQRVLKSGKIIYNNGSIVIDCTVRNISDTGAQLKVPTSVAGSV